MLPAFEMILDNKLAFTIKVCEWLLPEDHELQKSNKRFLGLNRSEFFNLCTYRERKEYNETSGAHHLS